MPLVVTEHRAHGCDCAQCGGRTQAAFPADVKAPVQYGARIAAFVVYLLHAQFLPQDRLVQMMKDLFGVHLAASTIARMSRDSAERLMPFVAVVTALVAGAPVKHLDETGMRICGKGHWLHIAATTLLTVYRVCSQRGSMMQDLAGIMQPSLRWLRTLASVHDHWKSYYTIANVWHALCNAHHLRELKALIEIEKEDWARKMQILLRRACHATNLAERNDTRLKPELVALFQRRYDKILSEGLAFHQALPPLTPPPAAGKPKRRGRKKLRIGHNLLNRLDTRKQDVLRFLYEPEVPFTNNVAEQAGRMMKVRQKISGCFRSLQGAADFAIHRCVLSTAQKQGWNLLDALAGDVQETIKKIRRA
jgi:transposase